MALFSDAVTIALSILFGLVLTLVLQYYGKVRAISEHYREAREVVGAIVLRFKNELEQQGRRIENIDNEIALLRSERARDQIEEKDKNLGFRIEEIGKRIAQIEDSQQPVTQELTELRNAFEDLLETQEQIRSQLEMLDERYRGLLPEMEAEQITPIVSNKFLSELNPTELQILHVLVTEGAKSATEVQQLIGKTREHAARLMKKLYDQGLVEREETKRPYRYAASKKIKELIKNPPNEGDLSGTVS